MSKEVSQEIIDAFADKKEVHLKRPDHGLLLDSGSTLLNLACSDTARGGYGIGRMVNIVGDSGSGKSFLALTALACACQRAEFEDYRLIYDDAEFALGFNLEGLFGKKLAKQLEVYSSQTVEEFVARCMRDLQGKSPCIYVLDSLDGLSSNEEAATTEAMVKSLNKEQAIDADKGYKMQKAKILSSSLRQICGQLSKTRSILIIVSQIRDNVGFGFEKHTVAGGKALQFYASHRIWLNKAGNITKNADKKRPIGVQVSPRVRKNKLTGRDRKDIPFDIYYDYGIDDIGSMIDWMVAEAGWTKGGAYIDPKEDLELSKGTKAELIAAVESDPALYEDMRDMVEEEWLRIEESLKTGRKCRFV